MALLLGGTAMLAITSTAFWACLPRGGKVHRVIGTAWEPYVGVVFCGGFALGAAMILSAVIGLTLMQ